MINEFSKKNTEVYATVKIRKKLEQQYISHINVGLQI